MWLWLQIQGEICKYLIVLTSLSMVAIYKKNGIVLLKHAANMTFHEIEIQKKTFALYLWIWIWIPLSK